MAMVDFRGSSAHHPFPASKLGANAHLTEINHHPHHPFNRGAPDLGYSQSANNKHGIITAASVFSPGLARKPAQLKLPSPTTSPPSHKNHMNTSRRTASTSTTATANTNFTPTRTLSNVSSTLSRTSSSRSAGSITPSSYVALMRKQKATVWCDRAQYEDPRIQAQQKAARMRAAREVSGANQMEGRSSTGSIGSVSAGVRSKIRHHGVPKTSGYNYANPAGGGVPMRLSASEVGDDGTEVLDDADAPWHAANHHQRTDSGRSASGSGNHKWLTTGAAAAANPRQSGGRYSQGSLRTGGATSSSYVDIPELEETPLASDLNPKHAEGGGGDYFPPHHGGGGGDGGVGGSDSSSERESSFGHVGQMKGPKVTRDLSGQADELRRRGSVDERSNTMGGLGGGKLFVANPD